MSPGLLHVGTARLFISNLSQQVVGVFIAFFAAQMRVLAPRWSSQQCIR